MALHQQKQYVIRSTQGFMAASPFLQDLVRHSPSLTPEDYLRERLDASLGDGQEPSFVELLVEKQDHIRGFSIDSTYGSFPASTTRFAESRHATDSVLPLRAIYDKGELEHRMTVCGCLI